MADGERRWAELAARIQDLALPAAERRAALEELGAALRPVMRTSAAGAVASEMLELDIYEWAWSAPWNELSAYVALGDLKDYSDAADLMASGFAAHKVAFALFDGWGCREHPEWRHRAHDGMYGRVASCAGFAAEVLAQGEGPESDGVMTRLKEVSHAAGVAWRSDEPQGGLLCTVCRVIEFGGHPAALREIVAAPVNSGGLEAVATSLREADVSSSDLYLTLVCAA